MKSLKIVLVGDTMVGKTALVNKWVNGLFLSDASPTIGGSNMQKFVNINGEKLDIQIWDTAGAERYRSLTPLYIKDAASVMIVFDITCKKSYESLEDWIKFVNNHGSTPFIIVGNKEDLIEKAEVQFEDAYAYAQSLGAEYFQTSARDGENVEGAFMALVKIGYEYCKKNCMVKQSEFENSSSEMTSRPCC